MTEYITKSELKESRDWTETGIRRFLGEPDEYRPNPYYRTAAPMCLYDLGRVKAVEGSAEYQTWRKDSDYVRHELTCYDARLYDLYGKVGTRAAYKLLNARIYAAITEAYPHLRAECERQLARKFGGWSTIPPCAPVCD